MIDIEIAEVLYLINRIESLMIQKGAKGVSFSDKVKSFDIFEIENPNIDFSNIGYKFYFKDGTYHIKDQYNYEFGISRELENYIKFKTYRKRYSEYRKNLLNGQYHTLRIIGHERNQLMHIYNYKINNYKKFIKACNEMIDYFENKQKSTFFPSKTILEKGVEKNHSIYFKTISKTCPLATNGYIFWLLIAIIALLLFIHSFFFMLENNEPNASVTPMIEVSKNNDQHKLSYHKEKSTLVTEKNKTIVVSPQINTPKVKIDKVNNTDKKTIILPSKVETHKTNANISDSIEEKRIDQAVDNCNYYYITSDKLNIREKPDKYSSIISKLHRKDKVCIIEKQSGWLYIKDKGWIYSKYATNNQNELKTPIKKQKKKIIVWHCIVKSDRASGWAESTNQRSAIRSAFEQCRIRNQSNIKCSLDKCYEKNN